MDHGSVAPSRQRITVWKGVRLLFASLVAVAIGLFGLAMWAPNLMTFTAAFDGQDTGFALGAVIVIMFAGPLRWRRGMLSVDSSNRRNTDG